MIPLPSIRLDPSGSPPRFAIDRQFLRVDLAEQGGTAVLLRKDRLLDRPGDAELRIIPAQAVLGIRLVQLGALVLEQGRVAQDAEAVGEPFRHIELPPVLGRERHPNPSGEGRRAASDVDGHVEDLTLQYREQLTLRIWVLEVEPAKHAPEGVREVVLHERRGQPGRPVAGAVPGLEEVTSLVAEDLGLDDDDLGQRGRYRVHRGCRVATWWKTGPLRSGRSPDRAL